MLNNNHQPCDFSETLVSYLYGEIGAAESQKFRAHAAKCVTCSAEIAGFSTVRAAVAEWRQEEFASLPAPAIKLPARANPVILTDEPNSWLAGIREFFTPKVALAAAGFAAIAIFVGLTFVVLNSRNSAGENIDGNIVAENSSPNKKGLEIANKINNTPPDGQLATTTVDGSKNLAPEPAGKTGKPVRQYASTASAKNAKNNAAVNTPKQKDAPKAATAQKQKTDLDTVYDEYEDDSLRLADLFADADTN